jgi:hypothetical protein
MQYMHQAVQLTALAELGVVSTLNPTSIASTAKRSTRTLSFLKNFIFSHLLPTFKLLFHILSLGFGRGQQFLSLAPSASSASSYMLRLLPISVTAALTPADNRRLNSTVPTPGGTPDSIGRVRSG